MSESEQPTDLSPERIGRLPRWAMVAFAARNALRVLPAFVPSEEKPLDRRVADLRTAHACCLIALRASLTGGVDEDLGERAVAILTGTARRAVGAAEACVSMTARAASARTPESLADFVQAGVGSYLRVAETYEVLDAFETAAGDDLSELEGLHLRESPEWGPRGIPVEYFSRPLYDRRRRIPEAWEPVAADWARLLESLGIPEIRDLHSRMSSGIPIDQDEVIRTIATWTRDSITAPPDVVYEASPDPPQEQQALSSATAEAPEQSAAAPVAESQASSPPAASQEPSPPAPPAPPAAPVSQPDVWMLSDRPLEDQFAEQDRFEFKDYADALAAILDHEKTDTPFTMAINAPWGAGKTTLANMIAEQLELLPKDRGQTPHVICRFNAWMHDDAPNLATAFISEVSRTANRHRRPLVRVFDPLPSAVLEPKARTWRRLSLAGGVLTLTLFASWWMGDHLRHVEERKLHETAYKATDTITIDAGGKETSRATVETRTHSRPSVTSATAPPADGVDSWLARFQSRMVLLGAFFTAVAGLLGILVRVLTSTSLGGFVQSPEKAAEAGAIQSAQRQLKRLIQQATWRGNRFVVFVDDIERCKPPRSVDVLDAVNQLMDHRGVLVVLLGDMSAVAAAAQIKYKDLAEIYVPSAGIALTAPDRSKEAFGRLYLQKIVQFQFDLPIPPKSRIGDYMAQLAITPLADTAGGRSGRAAS